MRGLQETGKNALVLSGMGWNEDGKAVGEDFQIQREGGAQIAVYIGDKGLVFPDGKVGFLEAHYGEEVRPHLHACQELWCRFQGQKPFKIVEEAEVDDPFISFRRWNEVMETSGGVGEHGSNEGRGDFDDCAVFLFNFEMVGFLFRYHLHALHVVSQGSEEGLFLDGNLAYSFGNAAGAHHIDKVAVIHPANVDIRFHRRFQHVDGSLGGAGNVKGPGQVVYRAERDKAEGGAAVDRHHAIDDFVNGTVAAHAYHIPPCFSRISGKIRGIPCFFRQSDDDIVKSFGKNRMEKGNISRCPFMARCRVDDDGTLSFFFHDSHTPCNGDRGLLNSIYPIIPNRKEILTDS